MQREHRQEAARSSNSIRLEQMKKRAECVDKLKLLAIQEVKQRFTSDTPQYRATLKNLIIQGMIKLMEEELELMVRQDEVPLVSGMLRECQSEYSEIMLRETTREYECNLTIREDAYLNKDNGGDCGGVILFALNRRIVCSNTLEDRLMQVFEAELPSIRKGLFPRVVATQPRASTEIDEDVLGDLGAK